ncbi:TPM domain-containing protein [Parasphingorhabdus cellanae]|uniref:TPM domain-containing protein n=1 Tax=Parasphingorhabdus cellanae TaxID=2806553 RepID=A0ABX7T5H7_9SPHN|nr:TPM domain-containing protein [Parasphingorhabdus cellanae]
MRILPHSIFAVIWAALVLVIMVPAGTVAAQSFPELTGRVVDQADLLDPAQEAAMTAKLEALEANSNRQLVVATVSSLEGYDIADYGYQLGRTWGIGQDGDGETEKDNGVILLVAPNDRKVRIEVGYGLEGIMTDALSGVIIQNFILPKFRDSDMPAGITAGVDAITAQLMLPEEEARASASQAASQQRERSNDGEGGLIIFWIIVGIVIIIMSISGSRGGKRYRGGAGPVVIWGGGGSSGWGSSGGGFSSGGFGGGGFSGGGGSFGGGGASGGW